MMGFTFSFTEKSAFLLLKSNLKKIEIIHFSGLLYQFATKGLEILNPYFLYIFSVDESSLNLLLEFFKNSGSVLSETINL